MSDAAERLRALRIKKGFANPIDAARAYGWNEHTYKAHENGIRGIRPDAARKYASAYQDQVQLSSGTDDELVRIQGIVVGAFIPV